MAGTTGTSAKIPQRGSDRPNQKYFKLVNELFATEWYNIGLELLAAEHQSMLRNIREDYRNVSKACEQMLEKWIDKQPEATWNQLIKALRAPGIELNTVASQIEGMLESQSKASPHPPKKSTAKDADKGQKRKLDSQGGSAAKKVKHVTSPSHSTTKRTAENVDKKSKRKSDNQRGLAAKKPRPSTYGSNITTTSSSTNAAAAGGGGKDDNNDDDGEKLINLDAGYGLISKDTYHKAESTVVLINNAADHTDATGFIGRIKLDGEFCIVLVTNHHVFKNEDAAEASSIVFEGIEDHVYLDKLIVKDSYMSNEELDCAMVTIKEEKLKELVKIEPIALEYPAPIKHGDQIYVIQHPRGRSAEFSSSPCTLLDAILMYPSGTDKGSSGSPVLKKVGGKLAIVALHKGGHGDNPGKVGYNYGILFSEILKWIRKDHFLKRPSKEEIQEHLNLKKLW